MKVIILSAILSLVIGVSDAAGFIYDAEYQRNYDGDTITFSLEIYPGLYKVVSARLYGVDTAEIRAACATEKMLAEEAKEYVSTALTGAVSIRVVVLGIDKYGRPLVTVYMDGKDLATQLVNLGYGRIYDGGKRQGWCS